MSARSVALLGALLLAGTTQAQDQPYTPARADSVLEQLTVPRLPGSAPLGELRRQWLHQPRLLAPALAYAESAIELGRREEDPRYFGQAQSALQPWWSLAPPPPQVWLLRARLALARQDFSTAGADLQALSVSPFPEAVQARLTLANLHMMQSDAAAALSDCTALEHRVDALVATTCRASAQALLGHAAPALADLRAALQDSAERPLSVQLWSLSQAAEIANRLGRDDQAEAFYRDALQRMDAAQLRDPNLLAAWADYRLQRGDAAAVVQRLDSLQRLDTLLLRLAMARRQLGADADPLVTRLSQRFSEMRQRGDSSHRREEALFVLMLQNDPARALEAAQKNWAVQREPMDARLLLLAAQSAQQPQAAQPVVDWLATTGLEDRRLQALLAALPKVVAP